MERSRCVKKEIISTMCKVNDTQYVLKNILLCCGEYLLKRYHCLGCGIRVMFIIEETPILEYTVTCNVANVFMQTKQEMSL